MPRLNPSKQILTIEEGKSLRRNLSVVDKLPKYELDGQAVYDISSLLIKAPVPTKLQFIWEEIQKEAEEESNQKQSLDSEYFTPSITDFAVGFEYEVLKGDGKWVKREVLYNWTMRDWEAVLITHKNKIRAKNPLYLPKQKPIESSQSKAKKILSNLLVKGLLKKSKESKTQNTPEIHEASCPTCNGIIFFTDKPECHRCQP